MPFCPNCGHMLNARSMPGAEQTRDPNKTDRIAHKDRRRKNGIAARVVICLTLVLVVGALIFIVNADNKDTLHGRIEIQTINDGEYFELSGDFLSDEGVFSVSLTDAGEIAFALTAGVSSQYDYYHWHLFDNDHVASTNTFMYSKYTGERLGKAEPTLYYLVQKPGEYDVSVDCFVYVGGEKVYKTTYSGTVTYMGNITKNYTWRYRGTEYNAGVTFSYDEYRLFSHMNTNGRSVTNYARVSSFVTYDGPVIVELSNSLRNAYGSDKDTTGQEFAQFVLSFVQMCFDYPSNSSQMGADKYQYGQDEYFAYPIETIFYGMGDCEDTSILCTALFVALGYNGAVVIVPGHAASAVGLKEYAPEPYSDSLFETIQHTRNGITYYICETTADNPQAIGLIRLSGNNGVPYSEYIGKSNYGFYFVESNPLKPSQYPSDDGLNAVSECA
ncbi:MAG: hypothetical protein FWC29_03285 [Methanomassiliicoccaceae archaeon]|nr:hypothetical protein [Methanomassiliicoccaceae archaeon]